MQDRYIEPAYRFRADRAYLASYTTAQGVRAHAGAPTQSAVEQLAAILRARGATRIRIRRGRPHVIDWIGPDATAQIRRQRRHFPTKESALDFRRRKTEELNTSLRPQALCPWDSVIAEFMGANASHSKAYSFFRDRALESFYWACRPRRPQDVTAAMLDEFFARLRAGQIPAASGREGRFRRGTPVACRQDYTVLHYFFAWCERRRYVADNPLRSIDKPRIPESLRLTPSVEEWCALLRAIPDSGVPDPQAWHLLLLLAAVTGIDRDDLLKIEITPVAPPRWEPFRIRLGDNDSYQITLISGRRTKTGRVKLWGLPSIVGDRIASRMCSLPDGSTMLFPWHSYRRCDYAVIRRAAHFPYAFQRLRAAAATQQAEAEALQAGADLLGHTSSNVTKRHYVQQVRLAVALARRLQTELPGLPPLPPYTPPLVQRSRHKSRSSDNGSTSPPH